MSFVNVILIFTFRIVRNRGNINENSKTNNHDSSSTTSNETTSTAILNGSTTTTTTTTNDDDSRTHPTGVSSSPHNYSIHSLLNHSQYNLHSNEYSTKRSQHHHHHGSRSSHYHHPIGK